MKLSIVIYTHNKFKEVTAIETYNKNFTKRAAHVFVEESRKGRESTTVFLIKRRK